MLKLFNNLITCVSCVMRVFHCVRLQKEPTGSLISCFHVLVAEHITFDAYMKIATHGFLIAANSSSCLYSYITSSNSLFLSNRSQRMFLGIPIVT